MTNIWASRYNGRQDSTSSNEFTNIPNFSPIVFNAPSKGIYSIQLNLGRIFPTGGDAGAFFAIELDGNVVATSSFGGTDNRSFEITTSNILSDITAGNHVVQAQWRTGGTINIDDVGTSTLVVEGPFQGTIVT